MKNLLEKAKPELLAGLEKEAVKHPHTVEHVRKALSKLYFVNHMTIDTWVDIRSVWLAETGEFSGHPWDLFTEEN